MRLWILGGNGFLGKQLQVLCQEKGIPFVATSKQEADVSSLESLQSFAKGHLFSHLINCAAYTDVDQAEIESELAYKINGEGPKNLGAIASSLGAKIIHISTDYVFDGREQNPYAEGDICCPAGVYGKSKLKGEIGLLDICPEACVIRTSWLFGKGGKNFISSVLTWMRQKEEVQVVSDQRGRPTYVKDLAEAIITLLPFSGIFHFANGKEISRFEMAQDIYQEAQKQGMALKCKKILPITSDVFPSLAKRPYYSVLSTKKFEEATKHTPRSWNTVLMEYICDAATSA